MSLVGLIGIVAALVTIVGTSIIALNNVFGLKDRWQNWKHNTKGDANRAEQSPLSALEFFINNESLSNSPRFKININSSTSLDLGIHNRSEKAIPFESFRISIVSPSISIDGARTLIMPSGDKQYIIDLKTENNSQEMFPDTWESQTLYVRVTDKINQDFHQQEILFARHYYDEQHKLRLETQSGSKEYVFSLFGEFTQRAR